MWANGHFNAEHILFQSLHKNLKDFPKTGFFFSIVKTPHNSIKKPNQTHCFDMLIMLTDLKFRINEIYLHKIHTQRSGIVAMIDTVRTHFAV